MRCKRLQGKALGPKIRTSEDPTLIFLVKVVVIGENHIPNLGASHKKEMDGKDKKL